MVHSQFPLAANYLKQQKDSAHRVIYFAARRLTINEVDARLVADQLASGKPDGVQRLLRSPDELIDSIIKQVYSEMIRIDDIISEEVRSGNQQVDLGFTSKSPCAVCGELGACSYDAEGRPMIHADDPDQDLDFSEDDE